METIDGSENDVLGRVVEWAAGHDLVRAVILESSRAAPNPPLDKLSDYDLLFVVSDLDAFESDSFWLRWYGEPLVQWGEATESRGVRTLARLVLYEDGTKVDHQVWPVERLKLEVARPRPGESPSETADAPEGRPWRADEERLSSLLDVGYRVLIDKDGIASSLRPPTYTAYIPRRPSEAEYLALVEEFWWESVYVAKNLWRDELLPWKYSFEAVMKLDLLRRMLEWRIEIDHDWSMRPGVLGRHLRRRLPPHRWAEVASTFVGPDVEANWDALHRTGDLFSRVAKEVGAALGYGYSQTLEDGVRQYWRKVRDLTR